MAAGMLAIWGIALWLYNSLFFKFCHYFALNPAPLSAALASFHFAYVLLAIPAVLFHRQFGFKLGLLGGMCVFGGAAFLLYMAITQHSGGYFVVSVLLIGCCGAWIDISLNALAALAGPRHSLVQRLNWAYAFNGAGLFLGYFIGVSVLGNDYLLSTGLSAQSSAHPYMLVGLGAILLAFLAEQISLPAVVSRAASKTTPLNHTLRTLTQDHPFVLSMATLAAYSVVLTLLWTANYKYQHTEVPGHEALLYERGWFWFVAGRLAGALAMHIITPARLMAVSSGLGFLSITVAGLLGGVTGWVALLTASLFLSTAYATIFGTGLKRASFAIGPAAGLLAIAAGSGNGLSSLFGSLALDTFGVSPRLVVLAALPFQGLLLYFALNSEKNQADKNQA